MKQLIFATSNTTKSKRFTEGLLEHGIEVKSLKDLNLTIEVEENGKDAIENARIKARACYEKTHMCTIGMDDSLYLENVPDELQPGLFVRRVNGKNLTDDEMIEHYIGLVKKYGTNGKLKIKWIYGLVVIDENGIEKAYTWSKNSLYMVDKASNIIQPGYPLNSITKYKYINKYLSEFTKEDTKLIKENEDHVVSFITDHIYGIKQKPKNQLELYHDWFSNLSFFQHDPFVLEEAEHLWKLLNYVGENYSDIISKIKNISHEHLKMTTDEAIEQVQNFFNRHKINLNIKSLIEQGILEIVNDASEEKNEYYGVTTDGHSYYDDFGERKVKVYLDGTTLGNVTLVHELSHYRNQPETPRTFENNMWTEAIAYATELIYLEELKNVSSDHYTDSGIKRITALLYHNAYLLYNIYKVVYLYKKTGELTKEAYESLFTDQRYDECMKEFEEYTERRNNIVKDTWLLLGLPVALYIYQSYKENEQFFGSLEAFNEIILNTPGMKVMDYLRAINIHSKDEFIEKIKLSTVKTIKDLEEIRHYEQESQSQKV